MWFHELEVGLLETSRVSDEGITSWVILVYSTSNVLRSPFVDSPIPGALMLFAGVFNIFVAALNILLRVMNGGRRS